jgi:hypothetical protein
MAANSPVHPHKTAVALHPVLVFQAARTQIVQRDTLGVARHQCGSWERLPA